MQAYTSIGAKAQPHQPQIQLDLFTSRMPGKPYASDDLACGLHITTKGAALRRRYIQPNPPTARAFMILDVDRAGAAYAWDDAGLPQPTWAASNPANGHAHLGYALHTPVCTTDAARLKPLRYLARIENGFRVATSADRAYTGLITKNPFHDDWRVLWGRDAPWELDELRDYLPDDLPQPAHRTADELGLGRNVGLFDRLRRWAYRARRVHNDTSGQWTARTHERAEMLNTEFADPLPLNEVRAIAKSVAKWTWLSLDAAGYAAWQAKGRAKQFNNTEQLILAEMMR